MQERHPVRSVAQVAAVLVFLAVLPVQSIAQSLSVTRPEFEAATVRASKGGSSGVHATTGRLTLETVSLRVLVSVAYKTKPSQIVGGPSWTASAAFNVEGKAAEAAGTDVMLLMLQSLLEDRFQLKMHHEAREGPVYELAVARGGHRLKPASDCVLFDPNHLPRQTAPGETQVHYCGQMSRGGDDLRRAADGRGVDITPTIGLLTPSLTGLLSEVLDRTVINKTGLTGAFDFHLEWAPQLTPPAQSDNEGPSIFTAVQEQLGLRLEAAKGPVDFLVIDHAEKPSDN
jgi:uncharacterized protein (TIGR03435 family)